jgi:hypothetical protein
VYLKKGEQPHSQEILQILEVRDAIMMEQTGTEEVENELGMHRVKVQNPHIHG